MRARRPAEAAGTGKGLDAHGVMRQNSNHKRPRNRGNLGRKPSNNRNQTFDSNGPSVRIRGNAFQVHEKYLTLARDAYASGDRVMAENYFQHAEHYYRIVNATTDPNAHNRFNGHANGYDHGPVDDDFDGDDQGHPMQGHGYGQRPAERTAHQGSDDAQGDGAEMAGDDRQGERGGGDRDRGGERGGGERRRRGRRPNGHDGGRDQANGEARAEGGEQAPVAESAGAEAPAEAAETPVVDAAVAADANEKPRRRTRRRSPRASSDGNVEGNTRDGDEEPVLI